MRVPNDIRVLVACEESQRVCTAFRARGFEAYSCDIVHCSGGHPEWHIQADALEIIKMRWDLIIAHPPCTFLSNAGACRLYPTAGHLDKERYAKGLEGKKFFLAMLNAPCDHVAVENPVPSRIFKLPEPSQIIQPYEFGDPYTKKTYLWLRGLPQLQPTNIVKPIAPWCPSGTSRKIPSKYGAAIRGEDKKERSKTFQGIAEAMAEQWGDALMSGTYTEQISLFEEVLS